MKRVDLGGRLHDILRIDVLLTSQKSIRWSPMISNPQNHQISGYKPSKFRGWFLGLPWFTMVCHGLPHYKVCVWNPRSRSSDADRSRKNMLSSCCHLRTDPIPTDLQARRQKNKEHVSSTYPLHCRNYIHNLNPGFINQQFSSRGCRGFTKFDRYYNIYKYK